MLAYKGVVVNAALLKRKFANGRTLLQVAQAGESAREAANQLVRIYKRAKQRNVNIAAQIRQSLQTPWMLTSTSFCQRPGGVETWLNGIGIPHGGRAFAKPDTITTLGLRHAAESEQTVVIVASHDCDPTGP